MNKAGVTQDEVEQRFKGWELVSAERMTMASPTGATPDRAAEWMEIWHYELRRSPRNPAPAMGTQ
jgi:hypothetical protein